MADRRGAGPQRPWTRPALVSALAAVLLHLPVLRYGFVWDDRWLIQTNAGLRGGAGLGRLLVSDFWAPPGFATGVWRPSALLALALLCKETAMVLRALVAVGECVERPRGAASSRGRWLAPYAVVTAVWAIAHLGIATTRVTAAGVSPALRWSALT